MKEFTSNTESQHTEVATTLILTRNVKTTSKDVIMTSLCILDTSLEMLLATKYRDISN